ncbi:MAG: glycosyl hydrolase family 28 protein [Candidatus Sumerlaeia bacterium]|nr:glycosyl hydrolase family 28 protein [Candidatus Sumerlaeia bacterium]
MKRPSLAFAGVWGVLMLLVGARAEVVVYPAPEGAALVDQYRVTVNETPVPVYLGSPKRFYGYCQFDMSDRTTVRVTTAFPLVKPRLLPERLGVKPDVEGNTVSFTLESPCHITLLPDGTRPDNALHLFANPLEPAPPQKDTPAVIFFGPGIHKTNVTVGDGQTLYLAGGSILKGAVSISGRNARARGRGIIDGSDWGHFERNDVPIRVTGTSVSIEGVIVRLSWRAGISVVRTSGVRIANTKVCASRFANDDGITVSNADGVTVTGCFVRTDDDCIALKGYSSDRRDVFNCTFEQSQLWCDRARIVLIGHETMVRHMRDLVFRDIDILKYSMTPFLIEPGELGTAGPNILFENIRVEGWGDSKSALIQIQPTVNRWMRLKEPGWVDGVTFRNIRFSGTHHGPYVRIQGYDAAHTTQNVTLHQVIVNGESLGADSPGVTVGEHTKNITFVSDRAAKDWKRQ